MPEWLDTTLTVLLTLLPLGLWCAFCLWAINWKRMWPTLAEGAWAPAVLLMGLVALVWSRIDPRTVTLFEAVTLPNLWWQLMAVALVVSVGLFFGWLQGRWGIAPVEVSFDPPEHAHDHGHDHGHDHHGHEQAAAPDTDPHHH